MLPSTLALLTLLAPILRAAPAPAPQAATPSFSWASDPSPPIRGPTSLQGGLGPYTVSPTDSAEVDPDSYSLVNGQAAAASLGLYLDFSDEEHPQPIRGDLGGTDPGPQGLQYERINPDLFAPPGTDSGDAPNIHWPMALSHNRILPDEAGWSRQQNTQQLPIATAMAGVDLRLGPGALRELHWHRANEWALVLNGSVRIQAINNDGATFVDDVQEGDVWFFPSGQPHSLQGLENGAEFLLVFDDGDFSDGGTNLITEAFLRTPKEVLSKNLHAPLSAFEQLPKDQLYIFNGQEPPADIQAQNISGPGGYLTGAQSYSYHFSQQEPYEVEGGSVKIIDPVTFPIASHFSAALVRIHPGAMREIHWHTTSDEWDFFISGSARMSAYIAPSSSVTMDFTAGDVAYIPVPASHYIENVGSEDVVYIEVLQQPKFTDVSLSQWIRLAPQLVVEDTLHLPEELLEGLPKDKQYIVQGNTNLTALAGEGESGIA